MLQQEIFNFITYLKSAHTSQQYLQRSYLKHDIPDPEKNSYQNCYRFLYYLEHGLSFYHTGKQADLLVKPILYFYGMVHLLKACLLTKRPEYPENTSMLAHGVSTRKRKKQQYEFLQDEVKVQHKGLFPYFALHLCGMQQLPFEKVVMKDLLTTIPEMIDLFSYNQGEKVLEKIGGLEETVLTFPTTLLDQYHMTENNFLNKLSSSGLTIVDKRVNKNSLEITTNDPLSPESKGPFFFDVTKQLFFIPAKRNYFTINHEIMNHYLLLYNLSMICRYETEWWGDLLHTHPTEDFPFIEHFLDITATKVPFLLGYFLFQQNE